MIERNSLELKQPARLESHAAGAGDGRLGTRRGAFPPPSSPFHFGAQRWLAHSGDDFGVTLRALGRGGPWGKDNMQGKAGEGQSCGMKGNVSLWDDML